jgi:soluble lytic murein transglycosylase-like protein
MMTKNRRLTLLVLVHLSILGLIPAYSSTTPITSPASLASLAAASASTVSAASVTSLSPTAPGPNAAGPTTVALSLVPPAPPAAGQAWSAALHDNKDNFEIYRAFHGDRPRPLVGKPYADLIRNASSRSGVDSLLLAAIVEAESRFDAKAVSHRGAIGLMQLMPASVGKSPDELFEPGLNLDLGAAYFRTLLDTFGGDLELALAAYNAGPGQVRRFGGIPPFEETRNFVDRVLAYYVEHHQAQWRAGDARARKGHPAPTLTGAAAAAP